jgi:hypothetical protein
VFFAWGSSSCQRYPPIKTQIKDLVITSLWQDPDYEINQVNCPEITIADIDPIFHGSLMRQAVAGGAVFDGAAVTIDGLIFDWNYDSEAQVLHITCTKKPFFIGCTQVEVKIRDLVAKSRGAI